MASVHLRRLGRRLGAVAPTLQQPTDPQVALGLALVARRVLVAARPVWENPGHPIDWS